MSPDLIVLAGFLWKMPINITNNFPNKIINIHPALLPKYGGKGMYGMAVHRAVKENGDRESGITIHYVNENYDEGAIIHQAKTPVLPSDTPETIAEKVHKLEYEHFPKTIAQLLHEGFTSTYIYGWGRKWQSRSWRIWHCNGVGRQTLQKRILPRL